VKLNIVGAGLAGALLAVLLAKRGFKITLYDRRPDPRTTTAEGGRSINLALASRGIRALERAGIMDRVRPLMIAMRGRTVHELSGQTNLQLYGQREHEVIYSVGRGALNRVLIEEAARYSNVELRFNETCTGALPDSNILRFKSHDTELTPTIATDGAGSAIRHSLVASKHAAAREDWLNHDYKELNIPPNEVLDGHSLHIWPRRGFMLIALPNTDGSFTATLFLERSHFAALSNVEDFFEEHFPDTVALFPNLRKEYESNPQGQLGTVHLTPWHVEGKVLLLGDAAHAIVPFHGQGMNTAFEDCAELDALLDRATRSTPDLAEIFDQLSKQRRPNTDAIAEMSLENYGEMRDDVLDPAFVRQKAIANELERRFPDRFIPRYSMVMFHPEIPYAEALRRGVIQEKILATLDQQGNDPAVAEQLVESQLSVITGV
jgi:kynurenine 3-monooxygenase